MPSLPHRLCAHLQNTSRAFASITPVPYSRTSLAVTSILLRQGLISNLTFGSPSSPDPSVFPNLPVSERTLWVYHKYRDGRPVLKHISLVSRPSQRLVLDNKEIGLLLTGRRAKRIPGVGLGEFLIIRVVKSQGRQGTGTAQETGVYMEGWEAWRAGMGGEVVCRVG
ncbi:hypothetical protein TREMEDRAFT_57120 [Tremella mesenterica DSM 1558]|uniref:uncharacterized protein n=1 Tax=Tremella mesenterica (strain ATCC 24925 / CBS 8224 / DSM 1558 / NBRC 9311 / NRRL Y-6157 / RJB 2259-6 / UBC 559-6) TaxID=578456 RepID=UPI0003F49274|nr:uncharacterized protein TREMEDRAFT_57120 [Tremella mesenterica DSM 1558]EIW69190.1 hypothetical protein TREMEDRAFT_57120 [Tremella mesenterica DSM 1558]